MKSTSSKPNIFIALIPWLLFSVLARFVDVDVAAGVGLVASIGIAAAGVTAGKPKILELGAVAGFVVLTGISLALSPDAADTFGLYARGVAAGMLSLIAFGSLLFTPFTEQYARDVVPASAWNSPRFKAANRELTTLWGGVFAAMVPCHIVAGSLDTTRDNLIFNWVLPVLLVLWAMKRSEAVADAPVAA
jgi:hypothetical protein